MFGWSSASGAISLVLVHAIHVMHVVHGAVRVSRYGVRTVIGQLGVEPPMDSRDQARVLRRVSDLCAIIELLVLDAKLSRFSIAQFCQPRHVLTVYFRRIGEVSTAEFL